jgi:hypothetical protein
VQYPACIAIRCADPIKGVASTSRFKPTVADITAWCEREVAELHAIVAREERERQLVFERQADERRARAERPALAELLKKHGPNFGLGRKIAAKLEAHGDKSLGCDQTEAEIRAEYSRLGRQPVHSKGGALLSPEVADLAAEHGEL